MADDSTRELALRSGDVHAIALPARQDALDRMRDAGMTVDLTAPANMFTLLFNLPPKPLAHIPARRAPAGATDRTLLVPLLGGDVPTPPVTPQHATPPRRPRA